MSEKLTGYPSIDKPWLKYYSEESINTPLPKCTVYESLYENNAEYPDDCALQYFGRKISYKELFDNIDTVRDALISGGVKEGDKVILFTSSTPETVYLIFALCRIGAVANIINPLFTEEELVDRINETDATIAIILDRLYDRIESALPKTCIEKSVIVPVTYSMPLIKRSLARMIMKNSIVYSDKVITWETFIRGNKHDVDDTQYEEGRPLLMVYSSGTTGASKGIVLTNDGINATISHYISPDFPYERGNLFFQIVPLWFSTGVVLSLLMPLCIGVTVILEPVFSGETFAKGLEKNNPHMTLNSISMWIYVKKKYENKTIDLSNLKYPASGGEKILPRVEDDMNSFLAKSGSHSPLLTAYGMCELGSTITTDSDTYHKSGASGYPMKGVMVAAFDPVTNQEQKYGECGELRVNSPSRMKEYFKKSKATSDFFYIDKDGRNWGRTGDIGYVDEDGFVFVLGRGNQFFLTEKGEKRYTFDIANTILSDERVAECEVVGVPVENWAYPIAQIVLSDYCTDNPAEVLVSIHKKCKQELEFDSVPRGYKIVNEFPVRTMGKRDMEKTRSDREGFVIPKEEELQTVDFDSIAMSTDDTYQ